MAHIAELVGVTPAEVLGTCSFYEMFKREPVGSYVVNVCTNISCQLLGGEELLDHAEERSASRPAAPPPTACSRSRTSSASPPAPRRPCLQVNYRYFHKVTHDEFDQLVDDLRAGRLDDEVPPHGTLARVRQHVPADRRAGAGDRPRGPTVDCPLTETDGESDRRRADGAVAWSPTRPEDRHQPLRATTDGHTFDALRRAPAATQALRKALGRDDARRRSPRR